MISNMSASEMALGYEEDSNHVVFVMANGSVECVYGPQNIKSARAIAARAIMGKYNALSYKVEIRPIVKLNIQI